MQRSNREFGTLEHTAKTEMKVCFSPPNRTKAFLPVSAGKADKIIDVAEAINT